MPSKYTAGTVVTERPEKPKHVKDFPLWAEPNGYWVKKIKGRVERFGRWYHERNGKKIYLPYEESWQAALKDFRARYDSATGRLRDSAPDAESITLRSLCNHYLADLEERVDIPAESGGVTRGYFLDQRNACHRMIKTIGGNKTVDELKPVDFTALHRKLAKTYKANRLGNEVTRIKVVFRYGFDNELFDKQPRYGSNFKGPTKAARLKERASKPKRLFSPQEIRDLIVEAGPVMKAAILLAINCGLGNKDIADLTYDRIEGDWIEYPRGKTGIERRIPVWPETLQAIQEAWEQRVEPADENDAKVILLTDRGHKLLRWQGDTRIDGLMARFRVLLNRLGINRRGVGFYAGRHSFSTYGLQTGDRDAVKFLMGHSHGDMLSNYDEGRPSDERLLAVTNRVRAVIFGGAVMGRGGER